MPFGQKFTIKVGSFLFSLKVSISSKLTNIQDHVIILRAPDPPTPLIPHFRLACVAQLVALEAENTKVLGSILDSDQFLSSISLMRDLRAKINM